MKKTMSLLLAVVMLAVMAFGMISTASAATTPINITVIGSQYPHFVQKIEEQWKKVAVTTAVHQLNADGTYTVTPIVVEGWNQVTGNEGAWVEAQFRYWKRTAVGANTIKYDYNPDSVWTQGPDGVWTRPVVVTSSALGVKLTAEKTKLTLNYKQFGNLIILVNRMDLYYADYYKDIFGGLETPEFEGYSMIVAESSGNNFSVSDLEWEIIKHTAPILGYYTELEGAVYADAEWNAGWNKAATLTKHVVLPPVLVGNFADGPANADAKGLVWAGGVENYAVGGQFYQLDGTLADVAPQDGYFVYWTIKAISEKRLNEIHEVMSIALDDMKVGDILTIYSNKLFVRFDTQVSGVDSAAMNVSAGKVTVEKIDKNYNSFFLLIPYRDIAFRDGYEDGVVVKFTPHGTSQDAIGYYRFIAFQGAETIVEGNATITGKKVDNEAYTLKSSANTLDLTYTKLPVASKVFLYATAASMTRDLYWNTALYDTDVIADGTKGYRPVILSNADTSYTFPAFTGTRTYNVVSWAGSHFWNTDYVCVNKLTVNVNNTMGKFDIAPAKDLRVQGTDTLVYDNKNNAKVSDYVTFESANPNVLTVDAEGNVKGIAKGTTWVYVNVKKVWNGKVYDDSARKIASTVWNNSTVYHIQVTVNDKAAIYMTNATIVGTTANIYKLPSLNSDVIGSVTVGTIIDYKSDAEVVNGFLKVWNNGADAYILMSQISFLVQSDNPAGSNAGVQMTVNTKSGTLNVRSAPGGAVVGKLAKGAVVTVVDTTNAGWYKLSDGNYVASQYLK